MSKTRGEIEEHLFEQLEVIKEEYSLTSDEAIVSLYEWVQAGEHLCDLDKSEVAYAIKVLRDWQPKKRREVKP